MASLLLLGNNFGDGYEGLDGEKTDAVLIVLCGVLEEGYHFVDHDRGCHLLDKLGEMCSCLAADHWRFVVHQHAELLAKLLLNRT